jgi:lipopolysaccharide transport system permease protein
MATEVILSAVREPFRRYLNPARTVSDLWTHRHLVRQFAMRDVMARYKGSRLGLLWSILNPLLMLAVFTFVFSVVFHARWGVLQSESKAEFALTMFCGLIVFNLFAECANRAPSLIIGHANYVKKIVFPLEILPAAVVASALVFALISTGILLAAVPIFFGTFSATLFLFPLVIVPLLLFSLGVGWFLASLGVYLRDIGHVVTVLMQILMFVTPIFYPISSVPQPFRTVITLNPLTVLVESARATLMWGQAPNWPWLAAVTGLALLVAQLGYAWFMKTKRGFADVL